MADVQAMTPTADDAALGAKPQARLNLLGCQGVACLPSPAVEETQMKFMLIPATFALLVAAGWTAAPVQAAGCLKGAAVGGVAGHYAGHHGVLGAGAGCVIGHHEETKHARQKAAQQQGASGVSPANPNSGH